eukprot:5826043-Prymnesium_polylepis.1
MTAPPPGTPCVTTPEVRRASNAARAAWSADGCCCAAAAVDCICRVGSGAAPRPRWMTRPVSLAAGAGATIV